MPPAKAGRRTFIHRLKDRKHGYEDALGAADKAWAGGTVDVSELERLLDDVLTEHLEAAAYIEEIG
jgi:hypothetical protein